MVKEKDTIYIYVKENPLKRTKATVTLVSNSGVVYFTPLKTLHFKLRPDSHDALEEGYLLAGKIYSTSDIENLVFTGRFSHLLGITLTNGEEATFEAAPTLKDEEPLKLRKVNVNLGGNTMKLEDIPKHENLYTSKLDDNGHASIVVNPVNEYFKAFSGNPHHHTFTTPDKKFDSKLTSFCEDAKKKAEEFKEATAITERVVNHGDIEYTVRMMLKAGLSPYQIAEEIQRQFYNAMVKE